MANATDTQQGGHGMRHRSWPCPQCDGVVRQVAPTEREPLRCDRCGARFRHPRMAMLLSCVLPGLGSIVQRRWLWGMAMLALGTVAFLGTLWRLISYLLRVLATGQTETLRTLGEFAVGLAIVVLAYVLDLLVLWLRRDHLRRL